MMTVHVHYIIFGCLFYFTSCQRPPIFGAQGRTELFESIGLACSPDKVLYSGKSYKVNIKELDEEVNALEFLTSASKWKKGSKKAVSNTGKIGVLAMHSWTFSLKPVFDGKVKRIDGSLSKITTEIESLKKTEETSRALFKLETNKNTQKAQNLKTQWLKAKAARKGASTLQRKLSRGLKGLRFLSQRLGPALGIFGSVFAIVSGFIDENHMQQQIDLLKEQMERGFAKLRREMEQKYLELKDYVDDSVQFAQVVDLQAELQVRMLPVFFLLHIGSSSLALPEDICFNHTLETNIMKYHFIVFV